MARRAGVAEEPRLVDIRKVFERFAPELMAHMADEEASMFPRIRTLATGEVGPAEREELRAAVSALERGHAETGDALGCFRELTDGYAPPEWACNTFRALYDGLARMERDMHQHVHMENNVLFPRVLASP